MSRLLVWFTLSFLFSLAARPAEAQAQLNSPDLELTVPFALPPPLGGRVMDMAYTKDGRLIAAWVEYRDHQDDRLVVASFDPPLGRWTLYSSFPYFRRVLEIGLTVPQRLSPDPAKNRIYIVAHVAQDIGLGADGEWILLISGPLDRPWGTPDANGWPKSGGPGKMRVVGDLPQLPMRSWRRMHPTVACVPTVGDDFTEYTVELAFAFSELASGQESILWSRSRTYGTTLEPTQRITGPQQSPSIRNAQQLRTGAYRHPSVACDSKNAVLAIGFQDDVRQVVHVLGGKPDSLLEYAFGTPENDGKEERAPSLATYDRRIYFTCLEGPVQSTGSMDLWLYDGLYFDSTSFRRLSRVHTRALSPGDLDVREGEVLVAARIQTDNVPGSGGPVMALRGSLQPGGSFTQETVSDHFTAGVEPRVAITPNSVFPPQASFGYTTRDWTKTGGVDAGFVFVDL
ncbi:MAG: hypothetical protein IPK67_04980 [Planctomycetes bacterium]|nr:hypothetical protein [Planctomycetota bacterium]